MKRSFSRAAMACESVVMKFAAIHWARFASMLSEASRASASATKRCASSAVGAAGGTGCGSACGIVCMVSVEAAVVSAGVPVVAHAALSASVTSPTRMFVKRMSPPDVKGAKVYLRSQRRAPVVRIIRCMRKTTALFLILLSTATYATAATQRHRIVNLPTAPQVTLSGQVVDLGDSSAVVQVEVSGGPNRFARTGSDGKFTL